MSKIDDKYILALDAFTGSLEQIVELLKSQQKNDKSDVVIDMLKNMPVDNIQKVVKDLKKANEKGFKDLKTDNQKILKQIEALKQKKIEQEKVSTPNAETKTTSGLMSLMERGLKTIKEQTAKAIETIKKSAKSDVSGGKFEKIQKTLDEIKKNDKDGFKDVKDGNEKILKNIESIKKQEESSTFDKIEDPKNKNKIVDGIKVVILIAAGVLALGMAFKLIGKVDLISVIAVSASIYILTKAFSKISEFKGLTFGKVALISSVLPMMATGLALSAYFLKSFPTITVMQGISILLIGGAMGTVSYLLLNALSKISVKSLLMVPLIPFILPLVALGIVLSSRILVGIKQLTLMQVFSIALVGLALAVAMVGIGYALKGMKNITWKELIMLPLVIPLIAGGIVLASWIFQGFIPIKNPIQLLIGSAVIGFSLLFFVPAIHFLGKMKTLDLLLGVAAVIPLAWVITKASIIFQDFMSLKISPLQLVLSSLAMGLGILAFTPAVWVLGKLKIDQIIKGIIAVPFLAGAIVASAFIFQLLPNEMKYPDFKWSLGVGLSFLFFAPIIYFIGNMSFKSMTQGMIAIPLLAGAILATAYIFNLLPKDMRYPDFRWTLGVGLTLGVFGLIVVGVGFLATRFEKEFSSGLIGIAKIAAVILVTDFILNEGIYAKSPNLKWLIGTGISIIGFGLLVFGVGYLATKFEKEFSSGLKGIVKIAAVILAVDFLISEGEYSKSPSINWSINTGLSLGIFGVISTGVGFLAVKFQKEFTEGLLGVVGIAAVILAVDFLIKQGDYSKSPSVDWMINTGLSIGAFGLLAFGIGYLVNEQFWLGLLGIAALAAIIMVTDLILGIGSYSKYPSLDWAMGVGLSLGGFGLAALLLGIVISTGVGLAALGFGLAAILVIAGSMLAVDAILNLGSFTKYPSEQWAAGVSKSMALFANMNEGNSILGAIGGAVSGFIKGVGGAAKGATMVAIATTMLAVDNVFNKGKFDKYPSEDWVKGIGITLIELDKLSHTINFNLKDQVKIVEVVDTILYIDNIFNKGTFNKYPSSDWVKGTKLGLSEFADLAEKVHLISSFIGSIALNTIAESMLSVDEIFNKGTFNKYPSEEWAKGVIKSMSIFSGMELGNNKNTLFETIGGVFKGIAKGVGGMLTSGSMSSIAASIVEVDKIFSQGQFDKYPSSDWATNISNTLKNYTSIESIKIDTASILKIVNSMIEISKLFSSIDWNLIKYPSSDWSINISTAIKNYVAIASIDKNDTSSISKIVNSMVEISKLFDSIDWNSIKYPTKDFTENISNIIRNYSVMQIENVDTSSILKVINSMISTATLLNSIDWNSIKYPSKDFIDNVSITIKSYVSLTSNEITNTDSILKVMNGMISAATLLNSVDWNAIKTPSSDWSSNVSVAIKDYVAISSIVDTPNTDSILKVVNSMINTTSLLNSIDWNTLKYPSKDFIDNFSYLITEINKILSSDISNKTLDFSINYANSLSLTSSILNNGKYDNYPNSSYLEMFSNFIISISELIKKSDLDVNNSNKFLSSTTIIIPAIGLWIDSLSKNTFNSLPSKSFSDDFSYFILNIGNIINSWKSSAQEAEIFKSSIELIVPSLKNILSISFVDPSFANNMTNIKTGLIEVGNGINNFVSLNLTLDELDKFSKSMKLVVSAINQLKDIPNINSADNMKNVKETLIQLASGIDEFMYEKPEGAWNKTKAFFTGSKRSMEDFVNFSSGLANIVGGLKVLSTLTPIPNGVSHGFKEFLGNLKELPEIPSLDTKAESINKLATSFASLADSLTRVNSNLQGFNNLSNNLSTVNLSQKNLLTPSSGK